MKILQEVCKAGLYIFVVTGIFTLPIRALMVKENISFTMHI